MSEKKLVKLKELMGKTGVRRSDNEAFAFLSFEIEDDKIRIATDRDWLSTTMYDLLVFLEDFAFVETPQIIHVGNNGKNLPARKMPTVIPQEQMISVRDILLDNIKKVQEDAKYIKQADSITKSVNALVGLAKTELQYRRAE